MTTKISQSKPLLTYPTQMVTFFCIVMILTGCGKSTQSTPRHTPPAIPIHEAVVQGDLKTIQSHIAAGSDLNELDATSQSTPLITAATFGQVQIAQALIDAGVDINAKNGDGSTALITAAFFCHPEIVQALLDKGADKSLRNKMGAMAINTVEGPWEMTKPIYDMIGGMLAPSGLKLDYERIQATRPKIVELLSDSVAPQSPQAKAPDFEVKTIVPSGEENYLHQDSNYIFNQEKLPTFELRIPGPALAKLDADPAAESYVEGSLTFEGETISPIGVRYKGSIGAWIGGLSDPNWFDPSGHKICTKLSMKIKINWKGSDRTFFGLKKIQLHSQRLDPSQMRERLGYWLFRQMGVPSPRCIHARLVINGQYSGLYALTEQIDDRFASYYYEDGNGNLYKEVWPLTSDGKVPQDAVFLEHLKTNDGEKSNVDLIRTFSQALASSNHSQLQTVLSKWLNIPEIIAYAVVDRTIRHDDGPFHWYCEGETCFNHNYYWYENPTEKQLHLIPWDLDSTFENIITEKNPITTIADGWGEITANGKPFPYGPFNVIQRSAAVDKLIAGLTQFEEIYRQQLIQLLEGPFSKNQINTVLDTWTEQIRSATLEASQTHEDAVSIPQWEYAIKELRDQVDFARSQMLQ